MQPTEIVYGAIRAYLNELQHSLDPQIYQKLSGYARSRNIAGLASCTSLLDVTLCDVHHWKTLRQVEAFVKKAPFFADEDRCVQAARQSFMDAELLCAFTNLRLEAYFFDEHAVFQPPDFAMKWIPRAQRYIRSVLGDFSEFVPVIPTELRVTAGATSTRSRRNASPYKKMTRRAVCTIGAFPYVEAFYSFIGIEEFKAEVVQNNRVQLVPKSWKTHRTIACEPETNLPFQLAFDSYVKRRLRRVGINLSDQDRNKDMAKEGSISGEFATVDFSAASDTVAYNTVALLFPSDWFEYLCRFRSPKYTGDFGEGTYEKFSSMGNGSTFTIESLLFASCAYAVGSKRFSVYGDDVIIEPEFFEDFKAFAQYLGFYINEDKSFTAGPFRESCGGDYFAGIDVTPVYTRDIRNKAQLCHFVNSMVGVTSQPGPFWDYLKSLVVKYRLPKVPHVLNTLSGVHLHVHDAYETKVLLRRKHADNEQAVWYKGYSPKSSSRTIRSARTLYLWYMSRIATVANPVPYDTWAEKHRDSGGPVDISITEYSSVTTFKHKYVRKWVRWYPPSQRAPLHLYSWSNFLLHES
jgi:hypothetical protein